MTQGLVGYLPEAVTAPGGGGSEGVRRASKGGCRLRLVWEFVESRKGARGTHRVPSALVPTFGVITNSPLEMRAHSATAAWMRWADVDLQERMIKLPAKRTKAGRKLDLPMSDYLHDLLTSRRSICGPPLAPRLASRSGRIYVREESSVCRLVSACG